MQPELQSLIPPVELTRRSLKQEGQDGRSKDVVCAQAQQEREMKDSGWATKTDGSQSETVEKFRQGWL